MAIVLVMPLMSMAQTKSVRITKFGRSSSLIATMNSVYDNNGEACAVIRFWHSGSDYIIQPNLGALKTETYPGETRLWVPRGTTMITVRHNEDKPLRGYSIPMRIESKTDYDAEINLIVGPTTSDNHVYISAGFNAMSIMGPSAAVGFDLSHHNIELGAVYGLNKSDDWYFYDSEGNVSEAYNYQAIRVQLRYGYEIKVADFLGLIPQVGAGYNILTGKTVGGISSSKSAYKSSGSLSALGALRLVASFSESFKLHITPEYDFGVYKDNTCKVIEKKDNKFKSWTEGFNLNVGLMIFF